MLDFPVMFRLSSLHANHKKNLPLHLPVLLSAALLLSGCATGIRETDKPVTASFSVARFLQSHPLSRQTRRFLDAEDAHHLFHDDPVTAISALEARLPQDNSPARRLALAEICLKTGRRLEKTDSRRALGYYLAAAEHSAAAIAHEEGKTRDSLLAIYNFSAGKIGSILHDGQHVWGQAASVPGPTHTYALRTATAGSHLVDPADFDWIKSADLLKVKGFKTRRRQEGVGAAMVGHRAATPGRMERDPFLGPAGRAIPLTLTIHFSPDGDAREATFAFHDILSSDEAVIDGRAVKLAADFTVPVAMLLEHRPVRLLSVKGMFHPEDYQDQVDLYALEPFRPEKIPVVFVHGILSSPKTWRDVIAELYADPVIRANYQFLVFAYTTGLPVPLNGALLREHLRDYHGAADANGGSAPSSRMVLVGHSMGGIISNLQTRTGINQDWEKAFTEALDGAANPVETQPLVRRLTALEADPRIGRVIFLSTPHRGSQLARWPVVELVSSVIKLPLNLLTLGTVPAFSDSWDISLLSGDTSHHSIIDLASNSPGLVELLEMPAGDGVSYHSIIGRVGSQPLARSSDSVVPYWSAHLPGAESEAAVYASHLGITADPYAIEELRRILYQHIGAEYAAHIQPHRERREYTRPRARRSPVQGKNW